MAQDAFGDSDGASATAGFAFFLRSRGQCDCEHRMMRGREPPMGPPCRKKRVEKPGDPEKLSSPITYRTIQGIVILTSWSRFDAWSKPV